MKKITHDQAVKSFDCTSPCDVYNLFSRERVVRSSLEELDTFLVYSNSLDPSFHRLSESPQRSITIEPIYSTGRVF